MISISR